MAVKGTTGILGAAIAIGLAIFWWARQPDTVQVWLVTVESGVVESTVANTRAGTIKACRRSRLSMPIGGVVDRLLVDEGDQVDANQLLLELWNRDRAADVRQAEQTLKVAEFEEQAACLQAGLKMREAKRIRELQAGNLASEDQVDILNTAAATQKRTCAAATNQRGVARARLDFQRAVFERTQLRAPFAGIIAEINGEVGEYITPSPPGIPTPAAIDLIDYSCLYVTAPIDEVDAASLRVGQPARVTLDAFREQEFKGQITRIAPYVIDLEKQARTVDLDVKFDSVPEEVSLLVGYSADITVILERREQTLRLPTETILPDNRVWILNSSGQLEARDIKTGIGNWSFTEILSGLSEGDKVVRNPDQKGIAEGVLAVAQHD